MLAGKRGWTSSVSNFQFQSVFVHDIYLYRRMAMEQCSYTRTNPLVVFSRVAATCAAHAVQFVLCCRIAHFLSACSRARLSGPACEPLRPSLRRARVTNTEVK